MFLRAHVPTVILVCMLSLSTSTLLRMTASRATRMYVRLMSNTMEVPETHGSRESRDPRTAATGGGGAEHL